MSGRDVADEYENRFPFKIKCETGSESRLPGKEQGQSSNKTQQDNEIIPELPTKIEIDNKNNVDYIDLVIERASLSEDEQRVISVMSTNDMQVEEIIEESGLAASSVLSALTLLQIKGAVAQKNGKRFSLKAAFR